MARMKDWKVTITLHVSAPSQLDAETVCQAILYGHGIKKGIIRDPEPMVFHSVEGAAAPSTNGEPMPGADGGKP